MESESYYEILRLLQLILRNFQTLSRDEISEVVLAAREFINNSQIADSENTSSRLPRQGNATILAGN